jgi:DNA-binding transcriptional ArsR family regulator
VKLFLQIVSVNRYDADVAKTARAQGAKGAERDVLNLSDPAAIKAIAHPARYRLVEELYTGKELTATEAAEICGLTPSAMSYHLRTLERYGLVIRGESTDGRERPWRKASDNIGLVNARGGVSPATARAILGNIITSVERLLRRPHAEGKPFGATVTQGSLRLTDEHAAELDRRVSALIEEFEADERPPGPDAPPTHEFFWIRGTRDEN